MVELIKEQILQSYKTKEAILNDPEMISTIEKVSLTVVDAYKNGKKTIFCGNGGSAGDAQHMAGEFVNKLHFDRPALSSIALTTDTSVITAIANDYSFNDIFKRQIEANGCPGDILFAISTSGNSANVLEAIMACKKKNIITVGLVGSKQCKMDDLCDYIIKVPCDVTPRIQESHLMLMHIICACVEKELFGKGM